MIVRELITLLGFQVNDQGLQGYDKSVGALIGKLGKLITVGAGAVSALVAIGRAAGENALELLRLAEAYDTTTDTLQRIPLAARAAGFEIKSIRMELAEFQQVLREVRLQPFGEAGVAFNRLGIQIVNANGELRETESILLDVARATEGLDERMRFLTLGRLFQDEDSQLALFLRRGSAELDQMLEKVDRYRFVVGDGALRANANFALSLRLITDYLTSITQQISGQVTPIFQEYFDGFLEFVHTNRELVQSRVVEFFQRMGEAVRFALEDARQFWKDIQPLIESLGGLERIIRVLIGTLLIGAAGGFVGLILAIAAGLGQLAAAVLFAKISFLALPVLIGVAAVALYLFLDDLDAWMNGQKSVLGEVLGDWQQYATRYREVIDGIKNTFGGLNDVIRAAFAGDLDAAEAGADRAIRGFAELSDTILVAFGASEKFRESIKQMFELLAGDAFWDSVYDKIEPFAVLVGQIARDLKSIATGGAPTEFSSRSIPLPDDVPISTLDALLSKIGLPPAGFTEEQFRGFQMAGPEMVSARAAARAATAQRQQIELNVNVNGSSEALMSMLPERKPELMEGIRKAALSAFEDMLAQSQSDFPQLE